MLSVKLDPEKLRTVMQLWRASLSHEMPMATEFQLHFMSERPVILRNYESAANAWLLAFRSAEAPESEQMALVTLIADIEAFQAWVKQELEALETLSVQTAVEAGLDELLTHDPDLVAKLTQRYRKKP